MSATLRVAIFDDVLAARREVFHIPGLEVGVYGDADDVCLICAGDTAPDVVCMDYAMGPQHANGADAIRAVRTTGFAGKIVAMSSDPAANAAMLAAGANESLLQKSMLRSYLVALGAGRLPRPGSEGTGNPPSPGEKGSAAVPVVLLLGALAAMATGIYLVGPGGHEPRYHDGYRFLAARVVPQDARRSAIDGIPAPVEAVTVWGAKGKSAKAFQAIAGTNQPGDVDFDVAAQGRRWKIRAPAATTWWVSPGPSRRIASPGDVPAGAGVPGFADTRYVATSMRVTEGQYLYVVGFPHEDALYASDIADVDHRAALGPDVDGRPDVQAGGFALLGLSALLLGASSRA